MPVTPNAQGTARKVENAVEDTARAEAKVAEKIDDLPEKPKVDNETSPELPAPRPDQIRLDLNDPASVDAYFKRPIKGNEGLDGHVIEKHVGKTNEELSARLNKEPNIRASSTFHDYDAAEKVVHTALDQNKQKIIDWLNQPSDRPLQLHYVGEVDIGFSVMKSGDIIARQTANVFIKKDGHGGFYFLTAYPAD